MSICTYQNHAVNPAAPMQFIMHAEIVLVFIANIKLTIPAPKVSTGSIINMTIIPAVDHAHDISAKTGRTMETKHIKLIIVAVFLAFIFLLPNAIRLTRPPSFSGRSGLAASWAFSSLRRFLRQNAQAADAPNSQALPFSAFFSNTASII